jgi:hypothetical protein
LVVKLVLPVLLAARPAAILAVEQLETVTADCGAPLKPKSGVLFTKKQKTPKML